MQAGASPNIVPRADSDGVITRQQSGVPSRRPGFNHEEDHDNCPFTALRRSSWFLTLLQKQTPTSPLEVTQILSSFSMKNDFMFYPPPSAYHFATADDGSVTIKEGTAADNSKSRALDGPHLSLGGIVPLPSLSTLASSANFEIMFIPLDFEVQAYHVQQAEVVVERRIRVGGPLFFSNFGCAIPCNVIRPHKGMSSHIALFFHCNGEDIGGSGNTRLATLANALHVTVVVPEYPGYGLFAGRPSEASIKGAMERVVQFLFTVDPSLTPSRVLLIGHSIGTGVAMHVAAYIQKLFEKYQRHYANMFICPEEVEGAGPVAATEPFAASDSDDAVACAPGNKRCRHNYLGGIVLLSAFATIDCIESMNGFKKYGITAKVMQYRQLLLEEDRLIPAPLHWADGTTDEESAAAKQVDVSEWQPPPLFRFARCYSFNRFPTVDVACTLQDTYHFFSQTPILLVHGGADPVIGAFHSVAIASKLRESEDGRNARVFLSILRDGGHNDMDCAYLIRRFYKDQILLPHVRRHEALQRRHRDVSSLNANFATTPRLPHGAAQRDGDGTAAAGTPLANTVSLGDTALVPNLHFLSPGEQVTVEVGEQQKTRRSLLRSQDDPERKSQILPMLTNLSFTVHNAPVLRQVSDEAAGSTPLPVHSAHSAAGDADDAGDSLQQSQHAQLPLEGQYEHFDAGEASLLLNTTIQELQRRVQPAEEPPPSTATMVHMALQVNADHTDVGSIMVAAMRQHTLPAEDAYKLFRTHKRKAMARRSLCGAWFLILALFVLGVGIAHATLSSASRARKLVPTGDPADFRRDNRVFAWYLMETVFNFIVCFLKLFHFRYGLGRLSKYRRNSIVLGYVYASLRIVATLLVVGVGVIMGMILSLGAPHHGGVDWAKWRPYPSKQRTWVSHVPRWAMFAFSIWHFLIFAFVFIKNH